MKKNLLLIVLLMTLIPLAGYSQNETSTQFTVAGVIVDATGEPLVGTAVYVKNEPGVGVVADLDGKFKIKVTKNATLIFQSVGMKNVEMLITKNEEKLKIVMKEDETKIDEVVVTGMSSQKKVSVVGAITTIDVAQLKTPATSLNNMIGGRMAGVITMQSSGEPGKNISNFWIRGISTFGASSGALVLIDGLEGRLEDIDTDDVESFSILKDAAATAVYGNTRSKWRGIGDYQTWYQWKIRGDRTCYDENITYQNVCPNTWEHTITHSLPMKPERCPGKTICTPALNWI